MGKAKKSFLGRLIASILVLILIIVALGLILFISPVPTLYAKGGLTGYTYIVTLAIAGIYCIIGGKDIEGSYIIGIFDKDNNQVGDTITSEVTLSSLGVDYFVIIGLCLVIVGTILFLIFYRNKGLTLIGGFFTLAGAILGGFQTLTFASINESFASDLKNAASAVSALFSESNYSIVSIGSICFAVISGLVAIYMIVHAARIKK